MKTFETAESLHSPDEKFRELVLFICKRSGGDPPFGATKLNKLLFYSDFLAYRDLGKAITGHVYQRLSHGPAPKAIVPIIKQLQAEGALAVAEHSYFGRNQKRPLALRDPNLQVFSAQEVGLVTAIIEQCWGKSATEMSRMSHEFRGWKLAADGEVIPYQAILPRFLKPTDADFEYARQHADELRTLAQECQARYAD